MIWQAYPVTYALHPSNVLEIAKQAVSAEAAHSSRRKKPVHARWETVLFGGGYCKRIVEIGSTMRNSFSLEEEIYCTQNRSHRNI